MCLSTVLLVYTQSHTFFGFVFSTTKEADMPPQRRVTHMYTGAYKTRTSQKTPDKCKHNIETGQFQEDQLMFVPCLLASHIVSHHHKYIIHPVGGEQYHMYKSLPCSSESIHIMFWHVLPCPLCWNSHSSNL